MTKLLPRGIRNNNPLNIRKSPEHWIGKLHGADPDFELFSSMLYGIRAAFVCVRTYIKRFRSLCITPTVSQIIARWAPSSENNTRAYITAVCRHSDGILTPNSEIRFEDKETVVLLLWSMSFVENGVDLPFVDFEEAYEMV